MMFLESKEKKLPVPLLLLALFIVILPFQLKFAFHFKEDQVRQAFCFYNALELHLPDLFLLSLIALSVASFKRLFQEKSILMLGSFLALTLFSVYWSETTAYPIALLGWLKLVLAASLFALFVAYAPYIEKERLLKFFFFMIVLSGVVQCGIVIYQFFAQEAVGLAWLGEP